MSAVTEHYKRATGFSIAAVPLLFIVGLSLCVATVPKVFMDAPSSSGIISVLWTPLEVIATRVTELYESDLFVDSMPTLARWAFLSTFLLPMAAVVASIRAGSIEPIASLLLSLILGLLSLPAVAWLLRFATIIYGAYTNLSQRVSMIDPPPLLRWVAVAVLILALLFALFFFIEGWIGRTVVVVGLGATIALPLASGVFSLGPISALAELLGGAWAWIAGVAGPLLRWALLAILGIAAAIIFLALVAQIGAWLLASLKAAWGSGARSSATADLGAGVGVALSVLLTAASVTPSFRNWLESILGQGLGGDLLQHVPTDISALYPTTYLEYLSDAFSSFSGFPEFALVLVACILGAMSLTVNPGGRRVQDGVGGLLTIAVGRVLLQLVIVAPLLLIMSLDND